jgi:hypothetical protein
VVEYHIVETKFHLLLLLVQCHNVFRKKESPLNTIMHYATPHIIAVLNCFADRGSLPHVWQKLRCTVIRKLLLANQITYCAFSCMLVIVVTVVGVVHMTAEKPSCMYMQYAVSVCMFKKSLQVDKDSTTNLILCISLLIKVVMLKTTSITFNDPTLSQQIRMLHSMIET